VFATFELVAIILHSVDELSLARVQGVNKTCRNVVKETKTLQAHLFLTYDGTQRPKPHSLDDENNFKWNPLLGWFATQMCLAHHTPSPLARVGKLAIFHFLPHALCAAKQPLSSVHAIFMTSSPAAHLVL
jgi:hypothetical protein